MEALIPLFDAALVASTLRLFTPILLAALGGAINERAGIFNIALEGQMLIGAFFAVAGVFWTGSPEIGLALAIISSTTTALVLGFFVIDMRGNAIVLGIAVNILALGLTTFLMRVVFGVAGSYYDPTLVGLPNIQVPLVADLPLVGPILSGYSILVYAAFALVFVMYLLLFRHPLGMHIRAVGEDAHAARSVGIGVRRIRYVTMLICGVLTGMAGAQLSISLVTQFVEGMTAGRGFIALVAVMFGRAHPFGVLGASLLFGFTYALTLRLQGIGVPTQFVAMLPYVATIVALILIYRQHSIRQRRRARSASEELSGEDVAPPKAAEKVV
jgi:ABC-type uncharacterized transport system permease subunit